jgi:DNA-binding NarL/FixJ family response regulator
VRVYRKLGVDNRAATVPEAVRRGLLEFTQPMTGLQFT